MDKELYEDNIRSLQEMIDEFGCNILNYKNGKIFVDHFYSEVRYNDFLNGINCIAGLGLFEANQILEFNKIKDNTLVIEQKDGIEFARHKYIPFFRATMEYKDMDSNNKKSNKTLTFTIRKGAYDDKWNFIDTEKNARDFFNIQDVKDYLKEKYGTYKLTDWSIYAR